MNSTNKLELAVYGQQCVMAGRVCVNPEAKYGDDWRDNADLLYFGGSAAELEELAASYEKHQGVFGSKVARAIREELAIA